MKGACDTHFHVFGPAERYPARDPKLRYKPPLAPEEILAICKRYGIEGGERKTASDTAAAAEAPQTAGGSQTQPRGPRSDTAVVWKLHSDNSMEPVKVSLGITDHSYTEVTAVAKGELKEGDELIIRSVVAKSSAPGAPAIRR